MKTTIDVADALLEEARRVAAQDKTTLRALLEEGLRVVLQRHAARPPFRLPDLSFGGEGLQDELKDAEWRSIRDAAYEGRGA